LHALCSGRELKRPTLDSQVAFLQELLASMRSQTQKLRCSECGELSEDGFGWRALLGCDEAGEDVEVVVFCPDALAASSTRWGERALFAPALLVARRALTGFVPPSTRILGANSFGSTHRGDRTRSRGGDQREQLVRHEHAALPATPGCSARSCWIVD
jgi:hypothetical protein